MPGIPARLWTLAPEGQAGVQQLALRLAAEHLPILLFASPEPKAYKTAQIIAQGCALHEKVKDLIYRFSSLVIVNSLYGELVQNMTIHFSV
jgi:Fructose-2,6-bisphosphatase